MEEIKAAELIYLLLEEGKFAEVAALLFSHHKKKLGFWIAIKRELLTTAADTKKLFMAATLLEVSSNLLTQPFNCLTIHQIRNF